MVQKIHQHFPIFACSDNIFVLLMQETMKFIIWSWGSSKMLNDLIKCFSPSFGIENLEEYYTDIYGHRSNVDSFQSPKLPPLKQQDKCSWSYIMFGETYGINIWRVQQHMFVLMTVDITQSKSNSLTQLPIILSI